MSVAPVTETGAKRRIGDILLELGFATEGALARAVAEQERTGQPLGQILVNLGVITRLELASALAEQWAEHASITQLPVPPARPRPAPPHEPHDEDRYAERLQAAVADLTQKVRTSQREESLETRVTELAQRIEATVARTQRLEVTMATLAESLEGVTGGVEEAFGVLQSGLSGLAHDLARIDTTVAELVAGPTGPTPAEEALEARLEELRRTVEELGAGEAAAEELEAQRAMLGELRSAVAELEARPGSGEEVDSRLARVETELAERLAAVPTATDVDALMGRLEALASGLEELRRATDVDAVLGELRGALDTLGQEVTALARDRPADVSGHLAEAAERLDQLDRAVADHASLAGKLETLEHRLQSGHVTSDDLSHALERVREELESRLTGVVTPGELERALERERQESAAPVPDEALTRALERLAERVAAVESTVEAAAAAPPPPDTSELESAVEALAGRLAGLEGLGLRVEELAGSVTAAAAPQPDVAGDLRGELDERLAELARTLEERFAAAGTQEPSRERSLDEGIADGLERTRMVIERLSLHLAEHDRALAEMRGSRSLAQRVDELSARIDDLVAAGAAAPAEPSGAAGRGERFVRGSLEPEVEIRSLIRRLEDVEEAASVGREKLMHRVERMASSIDWRLQRLEAGETE